jgi:hypothetical protein
MEKNFNEIYKEMAVSERDLLAYEIAQRCNIEMYTVQSWMRGKRSPRPRTQKIIIDLLCEKGIVPKDCKVTFDMVKP